MNNSFDTSASYLRVRTRGNSTPKGKRRIYFTCHEKDFEFYFDRICEDIFKSQDCAIYYTVDMNAPIPPEYVDADFGQMSIFVIPVTFRFLTEPGRALDFDYAYAREHGIPVLPLMMESNPDNEIIKKAYMKHFGNRHYFAPNVIDPTGISYEEKLKKYLNSILLDDETIKRIREEFDAVMFMSYRKKDRNFANELMKIIHSNPRFRDVAIWYDEFLTPGEDFEENIEKSIKDCALFTLVVTPNLVNERNYVQTTEYPYARKLEKKTLPAKMAELDEKLLKEQYEGIPDCVDVKDQIALDDDIERALEGIALRENDNDPEHCYYIGLAYLDGVDVERNVTHAVELITYAANNEYEEAMDKLYDLYTDGDCVKLDYNKALFWAQKLYDFRLSKYGEKHPATLTSLSELAYIYGNLGGYKTAKGLNERTYNLRREVLGEKHPNTLMSLSNLADSYGKLGEYKTAKELNERAYNLHREILGEKHPDTLTSLSNLANSYGNLGEYKTEKDLNQRAYNLRKEVLGEKHPDTFNSLSNLAGSYGDLGEYKTAKDLNERAYNLRREVLGEKHLDTLILLNNLALCYINLGEYKTAKDLSERAYNLQKEVLGEKHPDTLNSLNNLAVSYYGLGEYETAKELHGRAYNLLRAVLGDKHPNTLMSLNNLASSYGSLGEYETAKELNERAYNLQREVLGEKHPYTLISLSNLASSYGDLGDYKTAKELNEQVYNLRKETLGEKHPDTLISLYNLAVGYENLGEYEEAKELSERLYKSCVEVYGEKDPETVYAIKLLADCYRELGEDDKADALMKKIDDING